MVKQLQFFKIKQNFPDTGIEDVASEVRAKFSTLKIGRHVKPGQSVAVGVASRGTHDLKDLVVATVECLKDLELKPYITPAMGSHGGASADGQIQVLKGLGITEETVKAPIRASMDVVSLGRVKNGAEVFTAKDALEADHIMVINRVKPHTGFRSHVESGLCKITAVGLGRQRGAANMHRYDLAATIVPAAELVIAKTSFLCGLAVTENALGGTHSIRLASPEEFVQVDSELLKEAWELLPKLPLDQLDILIVDEMGKNISGTGMDPNVIGFWRRDGGEKKPDYNILLVLDLTEESHGNGIGIGMADLTTRSVVEKINWNATYINSLTSKKFRSVRMPMVVEDDLRALTVALDTLADQKKARVGRIVNTGRLETFWVSRSVRPELENMNDITIAGDSQQLEFDSTNRLKPFG